MGSSLTIRNSKTVVAVVAMAGLLLSFLAVVVLPEQANAGCNWQIEKSASKQNKQLSVPTPHQRAVTWYMCGGPSGVPLVPRPGAFEPKLPKVPWGQVAKGGGGVLTFATSVSVLNHLIKSMSVPDVKATTKTARRHKDTVYGLYRLYWGKPSFKHTYKYGITRRGDFRPKSQLAKCKYGVYGPSANGKCGYHWVFRHIIGWYEARKREASAIAAYKYRFGHCPPGQYYSCR